MERNLENMFTITELESRPPGPARILESLACEQCDEKTMESRTRRLGGRTLCTPCFQGMEQKI